MITKLYIRAQQALLDFKQDQRGVTAIEYAVLAVAVSAAIYGVFAGDDGVKSLFTTTIQDIKDAMSGS